MFSIVNYEGTLTICYFLNLPDYDVKAVSQLIEKGKGLTLQEVGRTNQGSLRTRIQNA